MGLFKRVKQRRPAMPDAPKGYHWHVGPSSITYWNYKITLVDDTASASDYTRDYSVFETLNDRQVIDAAWRVIEARDRLLAFKAREARYFGDYPPKTIPSKEA